MTAYLKVDHVGKTFRRGSQETEVLTDITMSVERGEYVSIIGHSGCGKSTLLNIVAGLLRHSTGAVLLENKEVNDPGPDRAVVFQNHSLLPWLTVYDNVRLAVDKVFSGAKSRKERHAWTMHNLELVQMAHAKDKRPMEISGGMKQRVGIARALGPLVIITMRSDSSTASSTSWVIIKMVLPSFWCSAITESCRWARVSASSAPKGSSSSSTFGSIASARAMPTRCFMPPEISDGRLSLACTICTRSRLCSVQASRSARVLVDEKTVSTPSRTFS